MVRINSILAILALTFTSALAATADPAHLLFPRLQIRQGTGNVTTVTAGAGAVGKGTGNQFTGGGCINDADCGSKCCAGGAINGINPSRSPVGICSGKGSNVEFGKGKTGCGFVDPNADVTLKEAQDQSKKQGF